MTQPLFQGIAFSSQGETIIAVDKEGEPLRKVIIWLDNRSAKEAKSIEKRFGNQQILEVMGKPIGTSMAMCVTLDKPVFDATLKLPCQCHVIPGLYFLLPYAQTARLVLNWFKEEFCREEIEMARKFNSDLYNILIIEAERIPPGAEGLTMLSHFMGTDSPEFIGAAILAGVGTGLFSNIENGCKICIKENLRFEPDQKNFEVYRKVYLKYLKLYNHLENYW